MHIKPFRFSQRASKFVSIEVLIKGNQKLLISTQLEINDNEKGLSIDASEIHLQKEAYIFRNEEKKMQ